MSNLADLSAKMDEVRTAVEDDETADAAVDAAHVALEAQLNQVIADLQAKVDAGFDTQPFIDQLQAIKATLRPSTPPATA